MRLLVGVDREDAYKPALQLLSRLRFDKPETTLAHFVSGQPAYIPIDSLEGAQMLANYRVAAENLGREALDRALDEACMRDLKPKASLQFGSPADGLGEMADQTRADLLAVRAEHGSLWATSFLGSVSRCLAIGCHTSLLIAKGPVPEALPLKIVLATDHSPEANKWISKFIGWQPKGISEIHVVTAYDLQGVEAQLLRSSVPSIGARVDLWVEEHLRNLNAKVVKKMEGAGYKATSSVGSGNANDVIRRAMQDTQSDLLVLGAQGHGFIERLLIGSCSMHQVVAEPYPVLVVR